MTILNNNAVALSLGELNKNISRASRNLRKLSSGMRLNGAGDSAAEYAISEKMRTMIRSLGQDIDNVSKGIDLVKEAENGINCIVDELRYMKEMAIDSANDHNSEEDRAIIQKEFASRMLEIDDIAGITNYNGIPLLDGRWYKGDSTDRETVREITRTETYIEWITDDPAEADDPDDPGGSGGSGESGGAGGVDPTPIPTQPVRPTSETVTIIPPGDYTISTDGVYRLDTGYNGTITITAQNVELQQTDRKVYNSYINCTVDHTNLWVNNLYFQDYMISEIDFVDKSTLKFTGAGNTVNIVGTNQFINGKSLTKAAVNVGGGVTFYDGEAGTENMFTASNNCGMGAGGYVATRSATIGAAIGTDAGENSNAYIVVNGGYVSGSCGCYVNVPYFDDGGAFGAGVGSGQGGSIGSISVNGGTLYGNSQFGAGIGSGYGGTVQGNIVIRDGRVWGWTTGNARLSGNPGYLESSAGAGIGAGENGSVLGDIIIKGGIVSGSSQGQGAGIGAGGYEDGYTSSVGNIVIKNSTVGASSLAAEAIGRGSLDREGHTSNSPVADLNTYVRPLALNTNTGDINIYGGDFGEQTFITGSMEQIYHSYTRNESDTTGADAPDGDTGDPPESRYVYDGGTEEPEPPIVDPPTPPEPYLVERTRTITEYITETETLWEPGNPLIIHTGPKANQYLPIYINDMHSDAMGLTGIAVNPREKALEAIDVLDAALEYALNESTRMGAYQMRLRETFDNLTSSHENTSAAESVIRDADMAREMVNYTRDNVLAEAAQAMLAQANQNRGQVLNLLQ